MNNDDYVFLSYISEHYSNIFLSKLLESYSKGVPMTVRKRVREKIQTIDPPSNAEGVLFVYILFKRTTYNGYVDELGKVLHEKFKVSKTADFKRFYNELKEILKSLELRPLEVTKQVVKNVLLI